MLQKVFITVLDMSIAAGYCAVFVMFARLFMKKLPKSYSYILWVLVFVRLLLPVVPESSWSLLPKVQILGVSQRIEAWMDEEEGAKGQAGVGQDSINQAGTNAGAGQPGISNGQNAGIGAVGNTTLGEIGLGVGTGLLENENESAFLPGNGETANGWLTLLSRVWLTGSVLLVGYGLTANVLLEKRLQGAKEMENGAYEIENLPTAFVTGLLNPRIYLPAGLSEEYRRYVLEHEKTHLKRGDVWVKYIAYMLTSIHWFNPLVWISYVLMCRDMEMSCDERVLQNMGMEEKKAYSTALLAVASGRKIQFGIPVAFGEQGAKGRIVNVLHYRKPAFWVTAAAGVVLVMLAVGLLSDPREEQAEVITPQFDETFLAQVEEWVDVMRPHDSRLSFKWFEDFTGEASPQFIEYNDSDIIFYPRVSDDIQKVIKKMLGVTTAVPYMELEKYEDSIWLVEYEGEPYLLIQREGVCRLQKYEDMIQYKQKEVKLEDVPIYSEDLKNIEVLSEKMSYGVNAVFLFFDYESVKDIDTVGNCDVVFDYIRPFLETGMIDHYFNEETYYQAMARKTGQELSEFKAAYKEEKHPYGRIYDGFRLDAVSGDIVVTDIMWLEDGQVEIYYSGWSQDGMVVMREQDGEMIFVSNSKRFKNEVITPQFDETFLQQVEAWIDVAAPSNAMGFSNWFEEYAGDRWFEDYTGNEPPMFIEYNDSQIVFYPRGKADISEMLKKMLGVTTTVPFVELEKYKNPMWVAEYNEEAYLLMQWKGICRLQKFEDMMQYKHKKVELKDIPIYSEDLNDQAVLSEKLSQGVNIVYLFRDYTHVNEMNPVEDAQLVFDNIRYQNTDNIIHHDAGDFIHRYFDEEVFLEIMARKAGQDIIEFLNGRNLETSWYQRVYKGWPGDSMRMEIEVTEVKWLDDSQVEVYYSGTYYNGVAVMKEHNQEMVFVSHRRIYEEERVEETEASGSTEEHELLWLEENWQTFMEQNPSLKGIEDWLEDAASPVAYGGVASWFEEYDGQQFSLRYQGRTARSAGVVFYLGDGETLEEIMAKLLESLYLSKIVHVPGTLDGEVSYSRYLEEKAHHVGEVWMIEYLDDYYVMMEWQGVYRLQRLKAIMEYKEKEIQFEYEPLYAEDFSNTKILSEKLSKAVNLLLLYRDYVEASAFHPKENYEDMFDFVERGWGEEGIINYYLDETKYYEAMAQKTGQSMAEMLATNNIELTTYNKLYRAVRGDAIYAQARVNEVKWLNDTQAEVHYAFGWFEDGFDTHYFDGVSVWEEYDGEMIFVSNRRIYD